LRHSDIHLRGFIIARLKKINHNDVNEENCKNCIVYYYLHLPKNFNSFYSTNFSVQDCSKRDGFRDFKIFATSKQYSEIFEARLDGLKFGLYCEVHGGEPKENLQKVYESVEKIQDETKNALDSLTSQLNDSIGEDGLEEIYGNLQEAQRKTKEALDVLNAHAVEKLGEDNIKFITENLQAAHEISKGAFKLANQHLTKENLSICCDAIVNGPTTSQNEAIEQVKQQAVRISHEVRRNSLQILEQETRPLRERANSLIVESFTEDQIEGAVEVCRRSRDYAYKIAENVAEASYVVVDAVKAEIEDILNSISHSRLDLREDQNNS